MRRLGAVLRYALLSLGAAAMVLPFLDMLLGALRTPAELLARPQVYWPRDPQWGVFARVFAELPMGQWLGNSVGVTAAITALQLATSALGGYALARHRFAGRGWALRLVVGAQTFPFFLLVIPVFFLLRFVPFAGGNDGWGRGGSGLLGSYAALVLPFAVSWYGVFLMRQFFVGVPGELLDAARVDGASEWRVFRTVALPQVMPGLATLGIFVFVYHWNEVIWTMTATRAAPALRTVPVGIYLLRGAFADPATEALQRAAITVSVVPVMAVFLCLQRFVARGAAPGGVKG